MRFCYLPIAILLLLSSHTAAINKMESQSTLEPGSRVFEVKSLEAFNTQRFDFRTPLVISFCSDSVKACKTLNLKWDIENNSENDFRIVKINFDDSNMNEIIQHFGVQEVPTVILSCQNDVAPFVVQPNMKDLFDKMEEFC